MANDASYPVDSTYLSRLVEALGDAQYCIEYPTDRYLYVSPNLAPMLGQAPEALTPAAFRAMVVERRMVGPCEGLTREETLERIGAGELDEYQSEVEVRLPDGQRRWLRDVSVPERGADGRVLRMHGTFRNITGRVLTLNRLSDSESRARHLIDRSPMGVHQYRLLDGTLILTSANPAADAILSIEHKPLIGLPIERAFPGLEGGEIVAAYYRIAEQGGLFNQDIFEYADERLAGAYSVHAFQVQPGEVAVLFQDMSEREWHRRELAASEERYRTLVESIHEILYVLDLDGVIKYVSPASRSLFDVEPEWLIGKNFRDLVHPDDFGRVAEAFHRAVRGESNPTEFRIRAGERYRWVRTSSNPILREGNPTGISGIATDVHERKQAEDELSISQNRFRALIENSMQAVLVVDALGVVTYASPTAARLLGCEPADLLTRPLADWVAEDDAAAVAGALAQALALPDETLHVQARFVHRSGQLRLVELNARDALGDPSIEGVVINAQDVTERRRAEQALQASEERFRAIVEYGSDTIQVVGTDWTLRYTSPPSEEEGKSLLVEVGHNWLEAIHADDQPHVREVLAEVVRYPERSARVEFRTSARHRMEWFECDLRNMVGVPGLDGILATSRNVTERKAADEKLRASEQRFRLLAENLPGIVYLTSPTPPFLPVYMSEGAHDVTGRHASEFLTGQALYVDLMHADDLERLQQSLIDSMRDKKPFRSSYRIRHTDGSWRWVEDWGTGLYVGDELKYIEGFSQDVTERKRGEEERVRQVRRLQALRSIDSSITSTASLSQTMRVLAERAVEEFRAGGVLVALLHGDEMVVSVTHGCYDGMSRAKRLSPAEGAFGAAIRSGELQVSRCACSAFCPRISIVAPLISKGKATGILAVSIEPDRQFTGDESQFLEALAGQAAIAADNALLFESLQRSNLELHLAYDATIEGWSRAMDLRDHETEGHTQRVTQTTVELARMFGLSEGEILHIRRGALLHDIGKMGVPDAVLLKPGKLDPDEWAIMREHPQLAHDMIAPIAFLRQAIDIPYCHHEKWDGSGYPRGLKGEGIPFSARLFAVVDVFDALTSDRPYRPAWSVADALRYISEGAGTHFDPTVVEHFLKLLSRKGAP